MARNRNRKVFSLTLPPDLMEELEEWCANQPAVPPKARAVEQAIRDFLDRQKADKSE